MNVARRIILSLAGAAVLPAAILVAASHAGQVLRFTGETSQNKPLTLTISGGSVRDLTFKIVDACPHNKHLTVGDRGFPPMPISGGRFGGKFTAKHSSATVLVSGSVSARSVNATLRDRTKSIKWHTFCSGRTTFTAARAGTKVFWRSARNPHRDVTRPHVQSMLSDRLLRNMHWSKWGSAMATGSGEWVAKCYFAGCRDWVLRVTLSLSRVRACPDGQLIFSRLVIHNPIPKPDARGRRHGKQRPLVVDYNCAGRSRFEGSA